MLPPIIFSGFDVFGLCVFVAAYEQQDENRPQEKIVAFLGAGIVFAPEKIVVHDFSICSAVF